MPFRVVPFRDRLLNRLVKRADPVRLESGEALWDIGDDAGTTVLLREGLLGVVATDGPRRPGGGEAHTVDLVLPWEMAGTEGVRPGEVRSWRTVAMEPSTVQLLDAAAVRRVLRRAERTFDAWLAGWRDRFVLKTRTGPGAITNDAGSRLSAVVLHLARRSHVSREGEAPADDAPVELRLRLPHRLLGELAGLHRSTVTTLLNDWIYLDLLEPLDPGWRVTDPATFSNTAGSR